ncbi:H2.0-like homeobox protein [Microtus ochrogaster]|uniref:H2.0-like homeobox protein n=1 Tax=Microtus ochrogaster TaxID=79684 RepID=A0A8J6FW51_MICOH|nr:H2.0-like homeobox protein [Microtus ochrogaster]
MFAAGLAPFYASNFSLWSAAYCSSAGGPGGCSFPLDPAAVKKPSFCIADILHAGVGEPGPAAEGLVGASAALTAHLGSVHPHASFQAATRSPLRPTPVVAPSEVPTGFPQRLSPLSAAYHQHLPQQQPTQQQQAFYDRVAVSALTAPTVIYQFLLSVLAVSDVMRCKEPSSALIAKAKSAQGYGAGDMTFG